MGSAVIVVITLSSAITYAINKFVLLTLDLSYMRTIVYILIIAALVQTVEIILKKKIPTLYNALGVYLPLITTNCAVLGVALSVVQKDYSLGQATVYAFATSLGYGLAMILFAGIREHLAMNDVPKAFKGLPIALITVSIMAMAFLGFAGIV